jgi:hypothetical protein
MALIPEQPFTGKRPSSSMMGNDKSISLSNS